MDRWKDKVAVVTGGASGIGAATVRRLVEHGMIVAGADRRVDELEELKSQLPSGRFHAFKCDVRSESDIVQMFNDIDRKFGRVDVLINNAGVCHLTSLLAPSADALHALFDVNVIGPCLCTREFLRIMRQHQNDTGYIMFTNSTAAHVIQSTFSTYAYTATKHALRAVVEGVRQELRASGSRIRVGEVSPGVVATNLASSFHTFESSNESNQGVAEYVAFPAPMQPEDIADAFVFMLSTPERADVNEIIMQHKQSTCCY